MGSRGAAAPARTAVMDAASAYTVKARRGHVVGLVKACGVSVSDAGTTGAPLSTYYSDARLCPRNYAPSYVERRLHGGTRFALWLCLVGMHGKRPRQGPDVSSSRGSPRSLARLSRGVVPGGGGLFTVPLPAPPGAEGGRGYHGRGHFGHFFIFILGLSPPGGREERGGLVHRGAWCVCVRVCLGSRSAQVGGGLGEMGRPAGGDFLGGRAVDFLPASVPMLERGSGGRRAHYVPRSAKSETVGGSAGFEGGLAWAGLLLDWLDWLDGWRAGRCACVAGTLGFPPGRDSEPEGRVSEQHAGRRRPGWDGRRGTDECDFFDS
ncbi:hypothetical protein Purlil1_12284 [Purpureocillium lilacinum]|uniref:Uncharacterized protein n=1 Tax=Purpureocillium lilacinum TaxID=33203 RepID=A0ABR0BH97_PURLI|nr:hypothetical protein Purlil1_12284 [Purpureocillium lilacinum]